MSGFARDQVPIASIGGPFLERRTPVRYNRENEQLLKTCALGRIRTCDTRFRKPGVTNLLAGTLCQSLGRLHASCTVLTGQGTVPAGIIHSVAWPVTSVMRSKSRS
jgi:hypothetical protein